MLISRSATTNRVRSSVFAIPLKVSHAPIAGRDVVADRPYCMVVGAGASATVWDALADGGPKALYTLTGWGGASTLSHFSHPNPETPSVFHKKCLR